MTALAAECYAGYRGEETPRRFILAGTTIEVEEILDRWLGPDHRYFKSKGGDGAVYILRQDVATGDWELTLFDATRDGRAASPPGRPGPAS